MNRQRHYASFKSGPNCLLMRQVINEYRNWLTACIMLALLVRQVIQGNTSPKP